MSGPDQAWVIAGLYRQGVTAEAIAERLRCSLRTVRVVLASPGAVIAAVLQDVSEHMRQEVALARSELGQMRDRVTSAEASERRLRDRIVRERAPRNGSGTPLCSKGTHPMTPANTYEHNGRIFCRGCHAERQIDYKKRKASV